MTDGPPPSPPPPTAKAPPRAGASAKRATFAAHAFGALRSAAGEGEGEPMIVPLVDIEEDPDQPRTAFDAEGLEALAESIRIKGVLQPVLVRPSPDRPGRWRLVDGARRHRASKLAGLADIPALRAPEGGRDLAAQVISNQQRAGLPNSDLARAVAQLVAAGETTKRICAICNLKEHDVAAFRAVEEFPAFLGERLDGGAARALYDLYRQWKKTPAEVEASMPPADAFVTITEARRIVGAITGRPTGSVVLDGAAGRAQAEAPSPAPIQVPPDLSESENQDGPTTAEPLTLVPPPEVLDIDGRGAGDRDAEAPPRDKRARASGPGASAPAPQFLVSIADGRTGRLATDRRARRAGCVVVLLDGGRSAELPCAEVRLVEVR